MTQTNCELHATHRKKPEQTRTQRSPSMEEATEADAAPPRRTTAAAAAAAVAAVAAAEEAQANGGGHQGSANANNAKQLRAKRERSVGQAARAHEHMLLQAQQAGDSFSGDVLAAMARGGHTESFGGCLGSWGS